MVGVEALLLDVLALAAASPALAFCLLSSAGVAVVATGTRTPYFGGVAAQDVGLCRMPRGTEETTWGWESRDSRGWKKLALPNLTVHRPGADQYSQPCIFPRISLGEWKPTWIISKGTL